jgi:hypothetical protein
LPEGRAVVERERAEPEFTVSEVERVAVAPVASVILSVTG